MIRAKKRLLEGWTYILKDDPAVDRGADDFDNKWRAYIDGVGECPLLPGVKPTIWHLSHPTEKQKREKLSKYQFHAVSDTGDFPRYLAALFACCCERVENFSNEAGEVIEATHSVESGVRVLSDEFLENVDSNWAYEIGSFVNGRMNLSPK